ncbi:MAG TPA: LLM class flavin-dependent oxidoreductase [Caulobacteraceae bacterium]|jgi:alkanesulfonate monooxygenase SsuD/methylene tetrahydromethanopterin reductase-like flavin-dependent oxidoreductase (luciferase family)
MKFGLFYELQLPKPGDRDNWNPEDERRIYHEMLEQVELADRVGFDYVFEVEHHFLEEYSHSSAPELMMAALSQRTRNIRLGHGIVLTPPRYNHPARVAERIAALDILSNGRVEFGTGESASEMELGGFGVERRQKKAMWEEATREIANMMTQTPYAGFEGEYFAMPPRNVIPKPVQKPHPPLWVAASRRETTMVAARLGMGSLGFGFETPEELGERAREYYRLVREELMPIGHAINPALAVLNTFMMAETDEEAMRRSANGPAFFSYSLGYYYNPAVGGGHRPGQANVYRDFLSRSGETASTQAARGGFLSSEEIASGEPGDEIAKALYRAARSGNAIGSADTIRRTLLKYEAQNLDVMIFVAQCGDRKHEHIMESIERFGRDVLPEFRERHAIQKAWRAEQLAGVDVPINSSI